MVFTPNIVQGFESDILTTAGNTFSGLANAGTQLITSTATPRYPGGRYVQATITDTLAAYVSFNLLQGTSPKATRFYLRITQLPTSGNAQLIRVGAISAGTITVAPTGAMFINLSGTGELTPGPVLDVGTWYCFEILSNPTSGQTSYWRIDGVDQTPVVRAGGNVSSTSAFIGSSSSSTVGPFSFQVDDLISGTYTEPTDWPGAGKVIGLRPVAPALSDSNLSPFQTASGVAVSSTTAATEISDITMSGDSTYVQQVTASSTSIRVGIEQSASTQVPTGVTGRFNLGSSAAQANNAMVQVLSGSLASPIHAAAGGGPLNIGVTGDFLTSGIVTPTASPWTIAQLNALQFDYGYSTDVRPVPYFRSGLIEVNFYEDHPSSGAANAGPDQTVKPWTTVTLKGSGTGSWSQISGTAVTLAGTGSTRTFTAPPSMSSQTLEFDYGGDRMLVTVNKASEAIVVSTGLQPIRLKRQ